MQRRASSVSSGRVLLATILIFGLAVLAASGCGDSEQEAAFREAASELGEAEEAVAQARQEVDERVLEAEEAREELAEAREELARAEKALAEARSRVGLHATDDVLFRAVQTRLLEDDLLEDLAIAARVDKGVVTLTGGDPAFTVMMVSSGRATVVSRPFPKVSSRTSRRSASPGSFL